jgi:hypothetical protein
MSLTAGARSLAFAAALFAVAPGARAQEEPTPFWLPSQPAPRKNAKEPAPDRPTGVYVAPVDEAPRRKALKKPARERPATGAAEKSAVQKRAVKKSAVKTPPPAAEPRVDRHAPLPPIPDVQPADVVAPPLPPAVVPAPPQQREVPAASEARRAEPRPAEPRTPGMTPPEPEARPPRALVETDAHPDARASAPPEARRFSLSASVGSWAIARADGSGRAFNLAYGAQLGFAPAEFFELALEVVRTSGSAGNGFASATDAHTLFAARALYALSLGPLALLAGAEAGAVLGQSRYLLQDVGAKALALDSSGLKPVAAPVLGLRLRPFRGLEARAEVVALLRGGRLEPLPLAGLGWAF